MCRCLATRSFQCWCQIRRLSGHSCFCFSEKWLLNRRTRSFGAVTIVLFIVFSCLPQDTYPVGFYKRDLFFGDIPVQNRCSRPCRECVKTAIQNIHFVPSLLDTLTYPTLLENDSELTPFLLSSVTFYLPTRNANNSSACKNRQTAAHFDFCHVWFIKSRFECGVWFFSAQGL